MGPVPVAGGTGLPGAPVVRELVTSGYDVRLLSRNPAKAKETLGPLARSLEVVPGTVTDRDSVDRAVRGCSHVHTSLNGGSDPAELEAVEHQGTALVLAPAARFGVELLSHVSGTFVHRDYGVKIPEHAAELGAERAIRAGGVRRARRRQRRAGRRGWPRDTAVGGRGLTGGRTHLDARRHRAHQPGHRRMGTRGAARGLAGHAPPVRVLRGVRSWLLRLGFVLTSAGFATGQP